MYHLGTNYATESPELSLIASNITQGNISFSSPNITNKLFFNPSVQSIYLPSDDWTTMMNSLTANYTPEYFICETSTGQCYSPLTCD